MALYVQKLIYPRDLIRELVVRDLKIRYKGAFLGFAWSMIFPLAQLVLFNFVFRNVFNLDIANYPAFLLAGLLAWSWFQSAVLGSATAIVDGRHLIKRPGFPAPVLPVVTVTADLIHFLLALPILLIFLVITGVGLHGTIVFLPFLILIQFLFALSIAYFLAALHVFFRDVQHLTSIALLLLFYATPVFYDLASVPEAYQPLFRLNPLLHLIEAYRDILVRGLPPDFRVLAVIVVVALCLFGLGYRFFRNTSYRFVEEL